MVATLCLQFVADIGSGLSQWWRPGLCDMYNFLVEISLYTIFSTIDSEIWLCACYAQIPFCAYRAMNTVGNAKPESLASLHQRSQLSMYVSYPLT